MQSHCTNIGTNALKLLTNALTVTNAHRVKSAFTALTSGSSCTTDCLPKLLVFTFKRLGAVWGMFMVQYPWL